MSYSELQRDIVAGLEYARAGGWREPAAAGPVDFAHDPRRCLTAVCFLPEVLSRRLYGTVSVPLQAIEPTFYYHPPDAMHVTIKNVRTTSAPPLFSEADAATCQAVFAAVVPRHPVFSFRLEDVVAFAASVSVVGYCDERLRDLVLDLDRELARAGVPDNKRYASDTVFFANVTLCRFTHAPSAAFRQGVDALRGAFRADVEAKTLCLLTCDTVCSAGSRRPLGTFALAGAEAEGRAL